MRGDRVGSVITDNPAGINLLVVSASPAQVAELSPGDEPGRRLVERTRATLDAVLAADPDRPIELVGSRHQRWHTSHTGSFRAWGAPGTNVGRGNYLPELVQRYLLGERTRRITGVRETVEKINLASLTIVAVDGSAGLSKRAPLALLPRAADADTWCRALLNDDGQTVAPGVGKLSEAGITEPDLWLELAAMRPARAELLDADTTLGVGRYLAAWEVK